MANKVPPEKILMVDDEINILQSFRRQLHGRFKVSIAEGPEKAQEVIKNDGPFAVVVSDMKMPGMDGAELLSWVRETSPETVRVILTGYSEMDNAIKAINQGHIFRFLTKPCEPEILIRTLVDGIRQYRLEMAERQLLEQTLSGSIKVLTDLLALANPVAFGRSARAARYVRMIVTEMELKDNWQYHTAAMLSQIGCLELPVDLLKRAYAGEDLSEVEERIYKYHPHSAVELLASIPRLESVCKIIEEQADYENYLCMNQDGSQNIGACILKAVLDMDTLELKGMPKAEALAKMQKTRGVYHPDVLLALEMALGVEAHYVLREVGVADLTGKMILNQDIMRDDQLILTKGQQLSRTLISALKNYHLASPLDEPIKVMTPHAD